MTDTIKIIAEPTLAGTTLIDGLVKAGLAPNSVLSNDYIRNGSVQIDGKVVIDTRFILKTGQNYLISVIATAPKIVSVIAGAPRLARQRRR